MDLHFLTGIFQSERGGQNDNAESAAPQYKTEFHRIYHEFVPDLGVFRDKYPLISLISMIAFTILGFLTMFSFSPTNILSGVILLTIGGSLAMSVKWNETNYWWGIGSSVRQVFSWRAAQKG